MNDRYYDEGYDESCEGIKVTDYMTLSEIRNAWELLKEIDEGTSMSWEEFLKRATEQ
jgi:hypothetical protein